LVFVGGGVSVGRVVEDATGSGSVAVKVGFGVSVDSGLVAVGDGVFVSGAVGIAVDIGKAAVVGRLHPDRSMTIHTLPNMD
jgi:hypothetical protein